MYTAINTPRGLFQFTRLPFGISSAPSIFQRVLENVLQGIAGVVNYLKDIMVTHGETEREHTERLDMVLQQLEDAGFRLGEDKCRFMETSVTYLGHVVDAGDIHPIKLQAIKEAPRPHNVQSCAVSWDY